MTRSGPSCQDPPWARASITGLPVRTIESGSGVATVANFPGGRTASLEVVPGPVLAPDRQADQNSLYATGSPNKPIDASHRRAFQKPQSRNAIALCPVDSGRIDELVDLVTPLRYPAEIGPEVHR